MPEHPIIVAEYKILRGGMTCGSAILEDRKYYRVAQDKSGRVWFWNPNDVDPAGSVYVTDPRITNSEGFAGRWLEFQIGPGLTMKAQGPWHSNASSLFEHTGVDLTEKYLTQVIIGKGRTMDDFSNTVIQDVLYIEKEPKLGSWKRGEEIAQRIADDLKIAVQCHSQSSSGSSTTPVYPTGVSANEWWALHPPRARSIHGVEVLPKDDLDDIRAEVENA